MWVKIRRQRGSGSGARGAQGREAGSSAVRSGVPARRATATWTAPRASFAIRPTAIRPTSIWIVTSTRAVSVTGAMSPEADRGQDGHGEVETVGAAERLGEGTGFLIREGAVRRREDHDQQRQRQGQRADRPQPRLLRSDDAQQLERRDRREQQEGQQEQPSGGPVQRPVEGSAVVGDEQHGRGGRRVQERGGDGPPTACPAVRLTRHRAPPMCFLHRPAPMPAPHRPARRGIVGRRPAVSHADGVVALDIARDRASARGSLPPGRHGGSDRPRLTQARGGVGCGGRTNLRGDQVTHGGVGDDGTGIPRRRAGASG
jgi:hypothetical protein